jgi:predicted RNA-binding Zn ribbon-like protein
MFDAGARPILLARGPLKRIGGTLCLDFINTVDWRLRDDAEDWLLSYADLLTWTEGAGALDPARAHRLSDMAADDSAGAERVLQAARALRETLFRLTRDLIAGSTPFAEDLVAINRAIAEAAPREGLTTQSGRLTWRWPEDETLETVLTPILWSAGDLLAGPDLGRTRLCAAEGCGWLFLDSSRKGNRLWCSMESCGNREKARRHYRRRKS